MKRLSSNEGPQQPVAFRAAFAVGRSEISFDEYLACVAEGGCNPDRPGDYKWGYQSGHNQRVVERRAAICGMALEENPRCVPTLVGGRMGIRSPRLREGLQFTPFWFDIRFQGAGELRLALCVPRGSEGARRGQTVPIDAAEPNPFGLLHMHGNVAEWVEDCWDETLAGLPRDGTARTTGDCKRRVGARRVLARRAKRRPLGEA